LPLYFAYGANMDAGAMARRCPRAKLLGRGRLARWRFALMPSGFATVAPDPRASVYGALWDLPVAEVAALDRFEEVAHGMYAKRSLPVLREPSGSARALVYIGADPDYGRAWPDYFSGIIAAARALSLPPAYVDYLERVQTARMQGPAA
jgi:gamma-glutamylcyclotransferase (GGCT)/AIG2-like uncharacterized protein YtfP